MVRLSLAGASLVRIEQQLTQRDENDSADERPKEAPSAFFLPRGAQTFSSWALPANGLSDYFFVADGADCLVNPRPPCHGWTACFVRSSLRQFFWLCEIQHRRLGREWG
jgi:hypothetical protein